MTVLLEQVSRTRAERDAATAAFVAALRKARKAHSWAELAGASGLTRSGVRYLIDPNANAHGLARASRNPRKSGAQESTEGGRNDEQV